MKLSSFLLMLELTPYQSHFNPIEVNSVVKSNLIMYVKNIVVNGYAKALLDMWAKSLQITNDKRKIIIFTTFKN